MKFVSWNVNGLRACMGKGFMDSFKELDADFFCLQETKLQEGQIAMDLPGYHQYWCYAQKKGYSGTAIFTRHEPQSVAYGIGVEELDTEGRVITLEYPEFYLVTCYTPNAQRGLARIEHRLKWEEAFRSYLKALDEKKPVILCGDLNVAHKEIDLKNPSSNRGNAGFSDEERGAFSALLDSGFTDSFRHLYPDKTGAYSWWSYMFNARQNNAGWRIDYFVVSDRLADAIHDATIHPDIMGSDHCPVGLDLNTTCNGGIRIAPPEIQEQPSSNDADGTSSVGIFRILTLVMMLILLGALSITAIRHFSSSPDSPTKPTSSALQESFPLIKDVIDCSDNCYWSFNVHEPWSSSLANEYFICGEEAFRLVPKTVLEYRPMDSANCFLQIIFDKEYSSETKPEITWQSAGYSMDLTGPWMLTQYYYGDDGNIAGCFLYGYCAHIVNLKITAHAGSEAYTTTARIAPRFDFQSMTTPELVQLIDNCGMVMDAILSSTAHSFESRVNQEPLTRELMLREDGISALLDHMEAEPNSTIFYLLSTPQFSGRMTLDELRRYNSLLDSKAGDLVAGWADGPAA